jgi:hypothetical protein
MRSRTVRRGQATANRKINLATEAKIIRRLQQRAAKRFIADVVEIGKHLAKVRAHVGHGEFLAWLRKNFSMSVATAERYMNVASLPAKIVRLTNLDLSVLYLLARPSTPPEIADEVVRRSRAGEPVTTRLISVEFTKTRETHIVPIYRPSEPERHAVIRPVYVDAPDPQLPASAESEPQPEPATEAHDDAIAFFDWLAVELPLPDAHVLAKAFRAQSRVSIANVRELVAALQELVAYLLDDEATSDSGPRMH